MWDCAIAMSVDASPLVNSHAFSVLCQLMPVFESQPEFEPMATERFWEIVVVSWMITNNHQCHCC